MICVPLTDRVSASPSLIPYLAQPLVSVEVALAAAERSIECVLVSITRQLLPWDWESRERWWIKCFCRSQRNGKAVLRIFHNNYSQSLFILLPAFMPGDQLNSREMPITRDLYNELCSSILVNSNGLFDVITWQAHYNPGIYYCAMYLLMGRPFNLTIP